MKPFRYGGAKEARTPDLLNAIQALYQLSYDPIHETERQFNFFAPQVKTFPPPSFSRLARQIHDALPVRHAFAPIERLVSDVAVVQHGRHLRQREWPGRRAR